MSRKAKKHIVTLKEAIDRIPHDEFYCLDSGRCPFWQLRKFSKGKLHKLRLKHHIWALPIWYSKSHQLEYCSFLREYLSIQDGCKDCGINCDYPQSKHDEYMKYLEKEYKEKDSEFYAECMEDAKEYDIFTRRIENREYADFYKERFPEEADLIDRIVEEDHLEYWHRGEEETNEEPNSDSADNKG